MAEELEIEHFKAISRLHRAEADLATFLEAFGNTLANQQGYKHVDGIEAVHLYLINKHHWTPAQLNAMKSEDIRFALSEEIGGWVLPKELRGIIGGD